MAVPKTYHDDLAVVLAKREQHGADYWATPDGRWGTGSPFSTFDCALILTELGVTRGDPIMQGIAKKLLASWQDDGRFRPAPKSRIYPCHTANAARALGRLGFARDRRLKTTFEHLLETVHDDGGWRCNTCKLGSSPETDASNPGVTLAALDAFRFSTLANREARLDRAASSLLDHWEARAPTGPCHFGIGSRFLQVEYPFLRYNLFYYVYVLSHYASARSDRRFRDALKTLENGMRSGQIVVHNPNRRLATLRFCRKGEPSTAATKRYREILKNLEA